MDFDGRAKGIVEQAEKALAALAAEAMTALDYAAAMELGAIARRVGNVVRDGLAISSGRDEGTEPGSAPSESSRQDDSPTLRTRPASPLRPAKGSSAAYPRFKREGETLVKIGWSKSDRKTYEHRSPRDVLSRLVARILELGGEGERFTTEQLMPMRDEDGAELPSYQVYLCLAWLVAQPLVERHGRQGYTVGDVKLLPAAVEQAWAALAKR